MYHFQPMQYTPGIVRANTEYGPGHWVIELDFPGPLPPVRAGQFVNLRCDPGDAWSLLRPFSVLEADEAGGYLSVYYKILGRMSERLTHVVRGERLDALFPLGGQWQREAAWKRIALVGGGVGIAPLLFFQRQLAAEHPEVEVVAYFGGRSAPDLVPDLLRQYDFAMHLATDDGSLGWRGNCVQLFLHSVGAAEVRPAAGAGADMPADITREDPFDAIYTCGPNPMMEALKHALPEGLPAFASLEEYMACATGACYGCTALIVEPDGTERRLTVCKDGPIFDLRKVVFET